MGERLHIEHIIKKALAAFRWTGENVFLGFLLLLLVALVFSSVVFYKYVFSLSSERVVPQSSQSNFENAVFQDMISTWQTRAAKFEGVNSRSYRDIFSPSALEAEELTEE
jgi:uncharacterized protein (UPF0333 family)